VNRKRCIKAVIIGKVLRLYQFRELRRTCDCTGVNVMVSQKLKSLQGIIVRNGGFSETSFFVVCDDIWIAIYPPVVVVYDYDLKRYHVLVRSFIIFGVLTYIAKA
jgi:hypothetical protein